jgi:hypothetical protein
MYPLKDGAHQVEHHSEEARNNSYMHSGVSDINSGACIQLCLKEILNKYR